MTSRTRLSRETTIFFLALLIALPALLLSKPAAANTETNRQVFEIKTLPEITSLFYSYEREDEQEAVEAYVPAPIEAEVKKLEKPAPAAVQTAKKVSITSYQYPPRVAPEERVYMHEPEIRAYLCPKMGNDKCEIFIAVLKAENGTHECTRDNRGVNKNGSLDVGLAQINWNPKHNPPYTIEQLRDCKFNLDIAMKKYQARGFQPWYAYTKGAYKKFLKKPVATPVVQ